MIWASIHLAPLAAASSFLTASKSLDTISCAALFFAASSENISFGAVLQMSASSALSPDISLDLCRPAL
ncbi:MAG: hypothetical protein NTZ10_04775 [Candidatus Saganbacteria bacterium]|nr:hypothetical protein [Candidatus Saganbacteria bacterium]